METGPEAENDRAVKRVKVTHDGNGEEVDQKDEKLAAFIRWCSSGDPPFAISKKLYMGKHGSCANYGMSAVADIDSGEELFRIPRSRILTWENLPISETIRQDVEKMAVSSPWAPTILAIMIEMGRKESPWREYLDLFLVHNQLDLPLFWDKKQEEELLQGTQLPQRIEKDRKRIKTDFNDWIFPALQNHGFASEQTYDALLESALKVSGFIMAYSFTRPEADDSDSSSVTTEASEDDDEETTTIGNALREVPLMVPLADFLNASISKNNAKLHWGQEEEEDYLTMIATKPIKAGEEVFNTYGEISNEELLFLYGYAEDDRSNPHEEVFIPSEILKSAVREMVDGKEGFLPPGYRLEPRWYHLIKQNLVGPEFPVVLGREGVLSNDDLHGILYVLSITEDDFETFSKLKEADVEQCEENAYTLGNLNKLTPFVRSILLKTIVRRMQEYPLSLEQEEATLEKFVSRHDKDVSARRQIYVSWVRRAQLIVLASFLSALQQR